MTKLNEYLQAEKMNSINVEGLYGDLQKRFNVSLGVLEPPPSGRGGQLP